MAANNIGRIVRLMAVAELMKNCRNPDGTYDPAKVKAYARSAYRKTALAAHPDHNQGNPELHPYFTEAAEVWEEINRLSNAEVEEHIAIYAKDEPDNDPQAEAMLQAAAQMIEDLQYERDDLQARLTRAHVNLIGVQRGQQHYTPNMVEIYSDPRKGIRITLANAATEIPRLLQGKADPGLEDRLRQTEEALTHAREYGDEQSHLAQQWERQAQASTAQVSTEARRARTAQEETARYRRELTEAQTARAKLEGEYRNLERREKAAADRAGREERRARSLEETVNAAETLLTRRLAEHSAELEREKVEAHKRLEDARQNPTSTKILGRIKTARDTKQYDTALQLCELLLDLEPGNTHALYYHGTVLEAVGRREEAGRRYFQLTTLSPGHTSGKAAYTKIEQQLLAETRIARETRQYEASLQAAQTLLRINPNHTDALYFAGANAAQLGRRDEAIAYLERLPKHPSARAILTKLIDTT